MCNLNVTIPNLSIYSSLCLTNSIEKKAKKKIDKIKKDAENKIKKLVSQVP